MLRFIRGTKQRWMLRLVFVALAIVAISWPLLQARGHHVVLSQEQTNLLNSGSSITSNVDGLDKTLVPVFGRKFYRAGEQFCLQPSGGNYKVYQCAGSEMYWVAPLLLFVPDFLLYAHKLNVRFYGASGRRRDARLARMFGSSPLGW